MDVHVEFFDSQESRVLYKSVLSLQKSISKLRGRIPNSVPYFTNRHAIINTEPSSQSSPPLSVTNPCGGSDD